MMGEGTQVGRRDFGGGGGGVQWGLEHNRDTTDAEAHRAGFGLFTQVWRQLQKFVNFET